MKASSSLKSLVISTTRLKLIHQFFYTPKEIVHYMCQEGLIESLSTKLSITETASFQPLGKDQTEIFGNDIKKGQLGLTQEHKVKSTDIEKHHCVFCQ